MTTTLSEVFLGIQGEGKTQGQYRQFIRVNGCNLSCRYCDSSYTWGKGDKHVTLPRKLHKDIVITGGECVSTKNWDYVKCKILSRTEVDWIEIETNGTYSPTIADLIRYKEKINLWNISPKKKEDMIGNINTDPVILNNRELLSDYIVKFVVKDESDLLFVKKIQKKYKVPSNKIWIMPLTEKGAKKANKERSELVYDLAASNKYNFSARLHVLIKGNKRGI